MEATIERARVVSDRESFAEFVRPHWEVMTALARRLAPPGGDEDALQDALTSAWRKRGQFDSSRGSARNWLLAIIADQAYKGRRRLRPTSELIDVAAEPSDGAVDVDLRAALLRLTERQRSAVALHYYLGVPIAEIALVLACSEGTVKSTLSDARAKLRSLLGEDYR